MKLGAAMKIYYSLFAVATALSFLGCNAFFDEEISTHRAVKTESDLRRDLFENYDKLVRPVKNPANAVPTWVSVTPLYVQEMDGMVITLDSWIFMKWQDDYLRWDPAKYDGITTFNLPCSEVWKPDLTLYTGTPASSVLPEVQTQVVINSTGEVLWVPPFTINSRCPKDDNRKGPGIMCNIKFGSWTYSRKLLDLQKFSDVDLSNFQDTNPDWKLVSATLDRESRFYPCCPDDYPYIDFNVTLTRRPSSFKITEAQNTLYSFVKDGKK